MLTKQAEDFLQKFDHALGAMQDEQRQDIVREVRSHFEERGATLDIATSFGTPEAYAKNFMSEQRLSAALAKPWPWRIVLALFATVRDTALFFVVLFVACFELAGLITIGLGVAKPFFSDDIGAYNDASGRFHGIGSMSSANGAHEILGFWAIPIFIAAGSLLFWICHRLLIGIVRWRLRLLRSRKLPVQAVRNDHPMLVGE